MPIKHKRSTIAGNIPSSLELGEIAINLEDKVIYAQHPIDGVIIIADNTSSSNPTEATVSIGDLPPSLPTNGKLWWDTNTGRMMIYYNDGTSSQWIEASPSAAGPSNDLVRETPSYSNLVDITNNVPNPNLGDEVYVVGQGKAVFNGSWVRTVDEITPIV